MDIGSMMLIIQLISKGIGVGKEIHELAQRCSDGETLTAEEIEEVGDQIEQAVDKFLT